VTQILDAGSADLRSAPTPSGPKAGPLRALLRALTRSKTGFAGLVVFVLFVLVAVVGPLLTPDVLPTDASNAYAPPSGTHLLGTDGEGRDIALLMVNGGRPVIVVGLLATMIATTIAVVLGAAAAYVGGWVDSAIVAAADIVLTVPQIVLLAVLAVFYDLDDPLMLGLIIGLFSWPWLLRSVRAQVYSLKEREYVEAARLLDLGSVRVIGREILPNMASFILMNFVIGMTNAIYALVGLYFLGLAPQSGQNWGLMLNLAWTQGAIFFSDSIFYVLAPVLAICILQLSLVTMTRSFEEILNPRLRDS